MLPPFTQFFNCFTNFNASSLAIYPSISSIFPVFCHGVTRFLHHYPYVSSVCLTRTQMHLPQFLPLHRINGFARFFYGFISVLLLHSGHTSEPQCFHCFSIVSRVLYAIMVPHRSLNVSIVFSIPSISIILLLFYLASFSSHIRATFFPLFFHCFTPLLHHSPQFFHCFSIANGLTSKPLFFRCFSIVLLDIIFPFISQLFLQFYSIVP